jgi:hypothetical protein
VTRPSEKTPPIFVLSAARSGSTLLRFILDRHPDLYCPPETRLAEVIDAAQESALVTVGNQDPAPPELGATRDFVEALVERPMRETGKKRWCDKSLVNVEHAELLATLWPEAKFICLFRHPMDMIHSGLAANPWGFAAHGFLPFVSHDAGNIVHALAQYWLDRTYRMLEFRDRHRGNCYSLRFEDLVEEPERSCHLLSEFLEVEPELSCDATVWSQKHEGPGDYQIWFTDDVRRSFIGEGFPVPVRMIPMPTRQTINSALGSLGYQQLDNGWGRAMNPEIVAGSVVTQQSRSHTEAGRAHSQKAEPESRPQAPSAIHNELNDGAKAVEFILFSGATQLGTWQVSVPWDPEDAHVANRSLPPRVAVTTEAAVGLIFGTLNLGDALRRGLVRIYDDLPLTSYAAQGRYFEATLALLMDNKECILKLIDSARSL